MGLNMKEKGMVPRANAKKSKVMIAASQPSMVSKASKEIGYVRRRTDKIIKKNTVY